jgi:fructose-1-phosphate kinase PfkB-like protein
VAASLGKTINSEAEALDAARMLLKMGAKTSAITMGKQGMLVASPNAAYMIKPPEVDVVNAVGSGDAAAAGFAVGLRHGFSLAESAKLAVACGTASVRHGFGRCTRAEVEEIKERIEIRML